MVRKAFRQGFYWPTATNDAIQIVTSYRGWQYFARQIHAPAQELQMIPITWPFTVWGLNLLRPVKKAPGGLTHLLVMVDELTKWVEMKSLAKIGSRQVMDFIQTSFPVLGFLTLSLLTTTLSSSEKIPRFL
jgi:hypothetical protein